MGSLHRRRRRRPLGLGQQNTLYRISRKWQKNDAKLPPVEIDPHIQKMTKNEAKLPPVVAVVSSIGMYGFIGLAFSARPARLQESGSDF